MLVMRKLGCELPLWFGFRWLACVVWLAEGESPIFSGGGAHVTNGADCRAGSNYRLACKELLAMTTHARIVIRKISDVREFSFGIPRRWDFVAGVAGKALVLIRRVKKSRILCNRAAWRLCLRCRSRRAWSTASLGSDDYGQRKA